MADRIRGLGKEVVASFQSDQADQRTRRLQHVGSEILTGMLPVIGWLERRRPAETANLVKGRLWSVLHEAVQCAGLDIPEYAGGKIARSTGEPSPGASRTATLNLAATMLAANLMDWADDIEAEDNPRPDDAAKEQQTDESTRSREQNTLSALARAVLEVLPRGKDVEGIGTKDIISKLKTKNITINATTFWRHVIPELKKAHIRVKNARSRGGYFIDEA